MIKIVGIQFKNAGRIYYFDPLDIEFNIGDTAIVETVRRLELGYVAIANKEIEEKENQFELKPVIRKGDKEDLEQAHINEEMAIEAFQIFKKYVAKLELPMKPLYAEYTIDQSKVLFYYESEDRVDFRELLRYLTPQFHLRVELRQISSREAARVVGGIGNCGREVCCKKFLTDFQYVTMKMAKDQSMSLNTSKISGLCGKLMCCIAFENSTYQDLKKEFPLIGSKVKTPNCPCSRVVGVDLIKGTVKAQEENNSPAAVYSLKDIKPVTPKQVKDENESE